MQTHEHHWILLPIIWFPSFFSFTPPCVLTAPTLSCLWSVPSRCSFPQDLPPYVALSCIPSASRFPAMELIFHRRLLSDFSCWGIGGGKKVSDQPQNNKYYSVSLGSSPIRRSLCTLSNTCSRAISLSPCLTLTPYLSIYPSHLICCTICAAVISRTPHVLSFTPLLSLPSWFWLIPPLQAWPPLHGCLTDLFASHDGATMQSDSLCAVMSPTLFLTHTTSCHYAASPAS